MKRVLGVLLIAMSVLLALVPATALAAETDDEGELLLRINGPVVVGPQEVQDNVVVISDDATVEGTVTGSLVVIDGDAVVTGSVADDVTVIEGILTLQPGARVKNVSVIRGTLVRDPGASVTGTVNESDVVIDAWDWAIFSAVFWVGMTLVVLAAGLIFAAVAGRQLTAIGDRITGETGPTLLATVITWIVMPIVMVLVFVTLVGIPLSLGFFLFVLPALWFVGYLVAGTLLGRTILRAWPRAETTHPYLAALVGLLLLQGIGWVPWFGGMIAGLAGIVGSGALVLTAWRSWRAPGERPETTPPPVAPVSAPAPTA